MKKAKDVFNRIYPIAWVVAWYDKSRRKSVKQLQEMGMGGADSILVVNIQKSADGIGAMITSLDGDTGQELSDDAKFAVWGVFAQQLSKSKALSSESRKVLKQVSDMFNTDFAPKKPGGFIS